MTQWVVDGEWSVAQGDGLVVTFIIQQEGSNFRGLARYKDHQGREIDGEGSGSISEDRFSFTVNWDGGDQGEYSGNFSSNGRLSGLSVDLENPHNQGTWVSLKTFSFRSLQ
jgi:hypothetical protein